MAEEENGNIPDIRPIAQDGSKETMELLKELKDLGKEAMIERLESKGSELSEAERKMLNKLRPQPKRDAAAYVRDRFQRLSRTRCFLKGFIGQCIRFACFQLNVFMM